MNNLSYFQHFFELSACGTAHFKNPVFWHGFLGDMTQFPNTVLYSKTKRFAATVSAFLHFCTPQEEFACKKAKICAQ